MQIPAFLHNQNGGFFMKGKTKQVCLSFTAVAVLALFSVVGLATQPQQSEQPMTTMKKAPKKAQGKKKSGGGMAKGMMANAPVPKGVQKCLDHLVEMANTEPMTPYEGHPSKIINEGLMWNDAKSNCSIGTDQALRLKVFELSKAWQLKDATTVRSLLTEIKSAAPQT
jgi:hypothetical protein